jgi:hypothetical protein
MVSNCAYDDVLASAPGLHNRKGVALVELKKLLELFSGVPWQTDRHSWIPKPFWFLSGFGGFLVVGVSASRWPTLSHCLLITNKLVFDPKKNHPIPVRDYDDGRWKTHFLMMPTSYRDFCTSRSRNWQRLFHVRGTHDLVCKLISGQ